VKREKRGFSFSYKKPIDKGLSVLFVVVLIFLVSGVECDTERIKEEAHTNAELPPCVEKSWW
jgi:hypothetical protein